jgi:hypothetical protein
MMDESELRRRFEQLRAADREGAPSFAQTYARARARRTWRRALRVQPLAIGAAAVVMIAAAWLAHSRSLSPSALTPTIGNWQAPTDVLLRTPGSELLSAIPELDASVLDTMIPKPSKRGALQ